MITYTFRYKKRLKRTAGHHLKTVHAISGHNFSGGPESKNLGGGGQPDSDMKVDFAEIGIGKIGKIGISDFFNLKLPILANFGKIGNKIFLEFPIFYSISATFIGVFVPILAKKVL